MRKLFIVTSFLLTLAGLSYGQQKQSTQPKENSPQFNPPAKQEKKVQRREPPKVEIVKYTPPAKQETKVHKVQKRKAPKVSITRFTPPVIVKDSAE